MLPDPAQVAALAGTGPRYTSYPPATEFRPLAAATVEAELAELGARCEPVGLYVHVPFCRSLCWYCGCNVIPSRDASRGDAYVEQLVAELGALRRRLGARLPLGELALGGGSPNFLSARALMWLMSAVDDAFATVRATRRTIELDPRTTALAQVRALAAMGFTSGSLGVQDFAPAVQDAIHRHQTVAQTRGLVDAMRDAGFDDVNVDLVYGLPRQSVASLRATVAEVIAMAPDRLALFGYAHLPERLPHQRLVEAAGPLPDAGARAGLLLAATEQLQAAGYQAIGLDHFARPGSPLARAADEHRLARSFQGYVARHTDATLGIGVSAISSTPRLHWQAPSSLTAWQAAVLAGAPPIARGVACDDDDRLRGEVIAELMCYGEVELAAVAARHGVDGAAYFADELAALAGSPLVEIDGTMLRATDLGRVLVRTVCQTFDRYAATSAGRFSPTV